ncbi:SCO family protein [Pseudonocardia sp. TRM90224]|uniref:SCO family protein n=1 Tax=Pseudonocardia sp. TRM90224 TaxID=2812678 RepID=UPI001E3EABD0|nr:SCO family protein [Pseudonocardia sp. TRM90224]
MTAPPIRATYTLLDHHGTPVTERTYRGRWQLVQFGFTSCKVVCPRALGKLSKALDAVEPALLVPLYISVDPERDTPAVMKAFLEATYPWFTGLTGTPEQIDDAKRAFKIFTRHRDTPDGYDVQHTALTYLLDPDGRPAHHWPDHHPAETITRDLHRLLTT